MLAQKHAPACWLVPHAQRVSLGKNCHVLVFSNDLTTLLDCIIRARADGEYSVTNHNGSL